MKTITLFLTLLLFTQRSFAGDSSLSGYLKDKSNGEALIGASVYVNELARGAVTNSMVFTPSRFLLENTRLHTRIWATRPKP